MRDNDTLGRGAAMGFVSRNQECARTSRTAIANRRQVYDLERQHRMAEAYEPRRAPWRDGLPIRLGPPRRAAGFRRAG
jgi:hypothetical protein